MVETRKVRVSPEFLDLVYYIQGRSMLYNRKKPSMKEITKRLAKYVNKEKFYQAEFI